LKKLFYSLVFALSVAEVVLVLLSWLLSATMTEGVRSLLSDVGIRWLLGSFSSMLATPWLVALLLLAMAAGCLWRSGLLRMSLSGYRERLGFRLALLIFVLYVAVVVALTAVPHAVLLSATGQLFPSPFSRALIPLSSFGVMLVSAVFGWTAGRFTSFADIIDSLLSGIGQSSPLILLYMVGVLFCESLKFVFL